MTLVVANPLSASMELKKSKDIAHIKVVAEDVDHLKSEIKNLHDVADKLDVDHLSPPEGRNLVEKLQKKCLQYTNDLMKDLLALDQIIGAAQDVRPLRKQQVNVIQQMMDDVDGVYKRLKEIEKNFPKEEEQKVSQEQKIETSNNSVEQQREEEKVREFSRPNLREKIRRLRLNPKMDISETRDAYIIASYVPGMQQDDIKISLGKNQQTISIEGVRDLSEDEEKQLWRALERRRGIFEISVKS